VAVPNGTTYLRFDHAYGFEDSNTGTNNDGGVLEYSTNNGSTWQDAGSLIIDNGYNGTISNSFGNPIGGREGFVGESNGYISSRVDLSSLADQSVRFRFRIGEDSEGYDYGWFIDDVSVYTCGDPPVHKEASVDIKPTTCPNALSTNDAGTTTVAILGTDDLDVNNVDPNTVTLQGVRAQSSRKQTIQDVAAPFMGTISDPPEATDCTAYGPDGKEDLVLKFASMDVVAALGDAPALNNGDVEVLELTGKLKSEFGGMPIKGKDVVVINKNIARY
jgi:hypothetical protein